jgi:hypothetical protein
VGERVRLVVFVGREPEPFVVVPGAGHVNDQEDWFVVHDPRRAGDRGLLVAASDEPVETVRAQRSVRTAMQRDRDRPFQVAARTRRHDRTGRCLQQQSSFPHGETRTPESTMHPQSAQRISIGPETMSVRDA